MPAGEQAVVSGDGGVPNWRDDEVQIRALVTRYFIALDQRDYDSLESCFGPDATGWYDREYGPGREAIVAYLKSAMSRWNATTHLGGNVEVVVGDGIAHAQVYAVAYLISDQPAGGGSRIRVRGLRYSDIFTVVAGRWLISRRVRVADWSFDVEGRHFTGVDSEVSPPPHPS
ncbi:MAG: nuclear transport factor 2 family protein [Candidatus Dormibacteria bacterium]